MNYLKKIIINIWCDEEGNTATEYAVMIALILVMCILAILNTGDVQQALWFNSADRIEVILPQ